MWKKVIHQANVQKQGQTEGKKNVVKKRMRQFLFSIFMPQWIWRLLWCKEIAIHFDKVIVFNFIPRSQKTKTKRLAAWSSCICLWICAKKKYKSRLIKYAEQRIKHTTCMRCSAVALAQPGIFASNLTLVVYVKCMKNAKSITTRKKILFFLHPPIDPNKNTRRINVRSIFGLRARIVKVSEIARMKWRKT